MKIRPIILCGGAGTRLWSESTKQLPKQFVDFGGWCLFEKTLSRIKNSIFDDPIISTNYKYLKLVKKYLRKLKFKKYKIVLEPLKKNTAPAILSSALIKDIPEEQSLIIFASDHLIENYEILNKAIKNKRNYLNDKNMFIFGIKPLSPSSEYGYFITKKKKGNIDLVNKFYEKPSQNKAKLLIKKKGYWNSGILFLRKDSIINNFKRYQPTIYKHCKKALLNSKYKTNTYFLDKSSFKNSTSKSFDHAILERTNKINAINLKLNWSDLGSWKEILNMYNRNKEKYFNKKNIFYRPWGNYTNLFKGKGFLIKELFIKPKGILSLQKHSHRAEHWLVIKGKPKITINKNIFYKKENDHVFIPLKSVHRVENLGKKSVKIIEAQVGKILKENDIIRYQDVYGRIN